MWTKTISFNLPKDKRRKGGSKKKMVKSDTWLVVLGEIDRSSVALFHRNDYIIINQSHCIDQHTHHKDMYQGMTNWWTRSLYSLVSAGLVDTIPQHSKGVSHRPPQEEEPNTFESEQDDGQGHAEEVGVEDWLHVSHREGRDFVAHGIGRSIEDIAVVVQGQLWLDKRSIL